MITFHLTQFQPSAVDANGFNVSRVYDLLEGTPADATIPTAISFPGLAAAGAAGKAHNYFTAYSDRVNGEGENLLNRAAIVIQFQSLQTHEADLDTEGRERDLRNPDWIAVHGLYIYCSMID